MHIDIDADAEPVLTDQAAAGQPRLRLITHPASPLSTLVEAIEAELAEWHHAMLGRLSLFEAALPASPKVDIDGAHAQIAFLRVGFRCIADAIGELAEHAVRLDADGAQRPVRSDRGSA